MLGAWLSVVVGLVCDVSVGRVVAWWSPPVAELAVWVLSGLCVSQGGWLLVSRGGCVVPVVTGGWSRWVLHCVVGSVVGFSVVPVACLASVVRVVGRSVGRSTTAQLCWQGVFLLVGMMGVLLFWVRRCDGCVGRVSRRLGGWCVVALAACLGACCRVGWPLWRWQGGWLSCG